MTHGVLTLLPELARFTAETFVAGLWQGLALIAAIAICLQFLPRISAAMRFAIWSFTFALVVAIPLLHLHNSGTLTDASSSAVLYISPIWAKAIAALWISLTIVRLVQLVAQTIKLRQIWNRALPIAAPEAILATMQSTHRCIDLCTSPDVDSPCVIGFLSPRLLVPESLFDKLTESDLHQIVLHECEHLRRRDDWINLTQKIALALFPLNPALLFVDRRLSFERELACDAEVISRTAAPFDYAHCLTRLAEHRLHSRRLNLALSAWTRQSELARRVHTLLRPMTRLSPGYARASVAALILLLIAGAVELTQTPHLVSFTNAQPRALASGVDTVFRSAPPQAIPVLYNGSETKPHATLLKVIQPSAKLAQTSSTHPIKQPRHSESLKPSQPRLMRTAIRTAEQPDRYSTLRAYYVTTEFSPSYAAVPFGDGWLIVQL